MAKMSVPIIVNAIDVVLKCLREFDDNFEFKSGVSEEYKSGFNDCKTMIINTFEKLSDEHSSKEGG